MNKGIRLSIVASTVLYILIILLTFSGYLTFGHGLGDLANLFLMFLWTICIRVFYRFVRNTDFNVNKLSGVIIIIVLICSIIYILIQLTINRGPEYIWDGHIFVT